MCEQDTQMRIQRSCHSNKTLSDFSVFMTSSSSKKKKSILRSVRKPNTNNKVILTCIAYCNWNSWGIRWEMRNKDTRLNFFVRH